MKFDLKNALKGPKKEVILDVKVRGLNSTIGKFFVFVFSPWLRVLFEELL